MHFHYTPTHASRLNQVEIWFSILQTQSLRGGSFTFSRQLRKHIDAFIEVYNAHAHPFEWRKVKVESKAGKQVPGQHQGPPRNFLTDMDRHDSFQRVYGARKKKRRNIRRPESILEEKEIIENLRRLRLQNDLSIGELAKRAGLSKSYVSKIENAETAPRLSTLAKLAAALNTHAAFLLAADPRPTTGQSSICVVRKDERKVGVARGTHYGFSYLSLAHKKAGRNMEPYIIEPDFHEKAVFSHEGEEFMYVLEGTHEFIYNGTNHTLNEGDSTYFDSIVPHTGYSVGSKRARILVVLYSYKR